MKLLVATPLILMTLILISQSVAAASLSQGREETLKFGLALYIKSVGSEPSEIAPGATATLKITLENVGDSFLKDIKVKLDLPGQFAPMEGLTEKKIRRMEGREITEVDFDIIALPNAGIGVYKVPLQLNYLDEIGNSYTENNTISLIISAVPQIFAKIDSSEIYAGKKIGKVVISLINNGVADIKFLTAELQESEDFEILTAKKMYVGELDSDDYETIEFRLKIAEGKAEVALPVMLDYSDANNKKYEETINVDLEIRGAKEAGIQESKAGLYLSIFLGLVVVFFVYRHYRRKRHKKHQAK